MRFAGNGRAWLFGTGSQIVRSQPAIRRTSVGRRRGRTRTATPAAPARAADDTCKVQPVLRRGLRRRVLRHPRRRLHRRGRPTPRCSSRANNLAFGGDRRSPRTPGNAGDVSRVIAGDPENPNRMWSVNAQPYGRSTTAYTRDGWQTRASWWQIGNDTVREFPRPARRTSTSRAAPSSPPGTRASCCNSIDGVNFFYNDAGGALATQRWNAVGLASASRRRDRRRQRQARRSPRRPTRSRTPPAAHARRPSSTARQDHADAPTRRTPRHAARTYHALTEHGAQAAATGGAKISRRQGARSSSRARSRSRAASTPRPRAAARSLLTIKKGKKLLTARNAKLEQDVHVHQDDLAREEQGRERQEARRSRCASRATRSSSRRRRT